MIGDKYAECTMYYEHDHFVGATFWYYSEDHAFMRTAFVEKYGKPRQTTRDAKQNAFGATFRGVTDIWTFPRARVVFSKYGGSADKGFAAIGTSKWFESDDVETKKSAKKAGRDF